jgi:UDP-N-acetylglucosamine--N-acetylmuramyl-(pentapeptide) pyrophosphoryl-undecaprenol N-acetylglucosamine transferase
MSSSSVDFVDSNHQDQNVTILISGGHLTPALATIEYFQKNHPQVRLVFVGREYSQEKEEQLAKEREVCEQLGIPFYAISAPKFHRSVWGRNIYELPKIWPSLWEAYRIIRDENVDLFLSFGGYLAVPIAFMAKLSGKKIVTHEQTKSSGLANELIALMADKVAISHEESWKLFPASKTVLTGNPIRAKLLRTYKRAPNWLPEKLKPILYITGGSQGSQVINTAVGQILPQLTEKFTVIHQCGRSTNQRYLRFLEEQAEELSPAAQANYFVREWIDEQDMSWIFQHAVLAISRSGANTTLEMTIHALPAIFIPLPFAHDNEQWKNAEELVNAGAAVLLEQKDLTPEKLWAVVQEASSARSYMSRRAEKLRETLILDGAENLAKLCLSLLPSTV